MTSEQNEEFVGINAAAEKELLGVSDKPDLKTRLEELTYELQRAKIKLAKAGVRSLKQDIEERKIFARWIFALICVWVVGLFVLLILQGFEGSHIRLFKLSDPVLLAIVGSTTVNVLGLFYIVAHYLFPAPEKNRVHMNESDALVVIPKKPRSSSSSRKTSTPRSTK
jgi:hypothetical protein